MASAVPHTERELLRRLALGDRAVFTHVYTEYYPSLFRYLHVVTKSTEQSEEILQDVFLKLWIKRATLTGVLSLSDYLFRMAKNRVFDERRKAASREKYIHSVTEENTTDVFDAVILKEYHQVVQKGIAQMPERRQQIFLMNAQEELTAKEIAEQLQLSLAVVKKQLYEAQHFLRKYLEEHGDIILSLIFCYQTVSFFPFARP